MHMNIELALEFDSILVIYNRFCPIFYTTNLPQDGGLACISPAYDKNTKMMTFVSLLEHIKRAYITRIQDCKSMMHFNILDSWVLGDSDMTIVCAAMENDTEAMRSTDDRDTLD